MSAEEDDVNKGLKFNVPDGSLKEIERIRHARDEWSQGLNPRNRNLLSRAIYDTNKEEDLIEVVIRRGKQWSFVGYEKGSKTFLRPEEALNLLEQRLIEIDFGGVLISVQQGYSLFLSSTTTTTTTTAAASSTASLITLEEYRVYCELSRLGYKLLRHNNNNNKTVNVGRGRKRTKTEADGGYEIPNLYGLQRVILKTPSSQFLPPNSRPKREAYTITVSSNQGSCSTTSLLRPHQCTSVRAIYNRLDLSASKPSSTLKSSFIRICFNAYLPSTPFRKSCPGRPDYKIGVMSSESKIPNQDEIDETDGIPVILAVVSRNGSTSFYTFSSIELPLDITMG